MNGLFQLTYISTVKGHLSATECAGILNHSRLNNRRRDLTGLLLFNGKRFLQVLEGKEADVRALFDTIKADPRHVAVVILASKAIDEREFGKWAMAFDDGAPGNQSLHDRTTALLERCGPTTRALFETTAELHRNSA